jgi:hypothetical protein
MSEFKTSKQFFSISNTDATNNTNINSMQFNFNNTALTDIQNSNNTSSSCVFTPVNLTMDWDFFNITEGFKNNKIVFRVAGTADQIVIFPDGSYNALTLSVWLNANLNAGGLYPVLNNVGANMVWRAEYDPLSNKIALAYATGNAIVTAVDTYPLLGVAPNAVRYDMTRIFGMEKSNASINQTVLSAVSVLTGNFVAPRYNPNGCDFKVFDVLRIHSNIAKRFYELKGNNPKVLSNNSVLFELVVPNITMGSSLVWECVNSDIYSQEVINNFDNLIVEIRDKAGTLIPFKQYCSFNMTFIMTRNIQQQSVTDRLKNISNFNMLSSV